MDRLQHGWLDRAIRQLAKGMRRAAHTKVNFSSLMKKVFGAPLFDCSGVASEGRTFFSLLETSARDASRK